MSGLLSFFVQLLGAASILVAIASLLLGVGLLLVGLSGGLSFPLDGVGFWEGLLVLGAGNLVCLALNVSILMLRRWHWELDWLRMLVMRFQRVPAVITVLVVLLFLSLEWLDSRGTAEANIVSADLASGSAEAVAALTACTGACARSLSAHQQLLLAAEYDRLDWAEMAIHRGGRMSNDDYRLASREQPILCENGVVVAHPDALEFALVHDNMAFVDLLLPLANHDTKVHALYTAVVLGREAGTQRLLRHFGWAQVPAALTFSAELATGRAEVIVPERPLACELPSWSTLGYPPQGR